MSKKTKRERQERQSRKMIFIVVGVILAVLIAGTIGIFAFLKQMNGGEPAGPSDEIKAASEAAEKTATTNGKLRQKAIEQIDKNDTTQANKIYDDAVKAESEVNGKIQLYVDLANVYYDAGKPEDAISTAKRALGLSSDKYLASDWLARAYEDQGNYSAALENFQIARSSVKSPQNIALLDTAYYDTQIARVMTLSQGGKR